MAPKSSLRRLCLFRPQNQSMSQRCGFFNVPSWVMEFKPGADWVRAAKKRQSWAPRWMWGGSQRHLPSSLACDSWEARGHWKVDTETHSQLSVQFLATSEPSSHMERVLIHSTSATCGRQPLARNQTEWERQKPPWHLQADGPLEEPVLDLELHLQINFH